MREEFVEAVLRAIVKETAKAVKVEINQLVEVEEGKFQALFFFNCGDSFGVVKCRGKLELFRNINLIVKFKKEFTQQVERKLKLSMQQEPVAVFETSLCLN